MPEGDCTNRRARPRDAVTEAEVEALVRGICFKNGPPAAVGVELEWLVHDRRSPRLPVTSARVEAARAALRTRSLHSAVTVEPGGQLELSSLPAASLMECVSAVAADLTVVRDTLRPLDLTLTGLGADPWRAPTRLLREPRYDAMESWLDRAGEAGRRMMCSTASVQICLDAGYAEPGPLGFARRWRLAHLLGPVLVAAFANSPVQDGRATGWRSTRQAVWAGIDPGRSGAPALDEEPRAAWARHALDAPVMCVRTESAGAADGAPWLVPQGLSFRSWVRSGLPRPPTRGDLDYHLTTLFPPVRPRGHLELRMVDAQSGADGWVVPLAVTMALFDDAQAAETAYRTVKPLAERAGATPAPHSPLWLDAARHGLADPELREAATACFDAALDALPRLGAAPAVLAAVAAHADRYVVRGRCPADDLLDELDAQGALAPGKDVPR
ncbi:ergothioneine biosynthesis glutamate--cysteine ligase EgtA [Streptomyces spectabilis]|uniref:Glutamate--cysteine ligase EgtA n=1 Tax=Streptomyces spectabilis TaxID=68270 RepID=A0A5P2XID4_STRST|nr:ergothioneine biosynthesis glutamate--cysteine ligase EgtA [Streptomyces spectabilis]MBB5105386.1 glutamate--cysteine ligase [Streptomyces spectabilis]MCI3906579.1 ergothioneine biosynthesis glutamate--cysteine ligase EgtA [Streptomyces spectabilis]QEV63404.1 ergothioneine biosynthesis glutamate--cysteine ligase EgtA [Streptomyces spectabilis]